MGRSKKVRIAVRAFITDEQDRILILKRSNTEYCSGWWNLPGGKLNYNQTMVESIMSEILEETNLECLTTEFLFYMDNLPRKEYNSHFLTMFFKCKCQGIVKINNESVDFHWLEKNEMNGFQLAFEHDKAIKRFRNE